MVKGWAEGLSRLLGWLLPRCAGSFFSEKSRRRVFPICSLFSQLNLFLRPHTLYPSIPLVEKIRGRAKLHRIPFPLGFRSVLGKRLSPFRSRALTR